MFGILFESSYFLRTVSIHPSHIQWCALSFHYLTYLQKPFTLLVIKMDVFFYRSHIETNCFFFGSFITLEQVNDYVMILEYQGEVNMQNFVLPHMTFVWSYGRPSVPYSVFFPALSLCAMNPCFFRVNCYLCNKNRHIRSLGYSSFDIVVSKPHSGCTLTRRADTSRYCWFCRIIAECGL